MKVRLIQSEGVGMNFLPIVFLGLMLCLSQKSWGLTGSEVVDSLSEGLETHAFVSQGFIFSLENNYLADSSKNGSFEFTEVGLNFTKNLANNLRMGMQFFARDIGTTEEFDVTFDWFYLSYRWSDLVGVSFGKIKIPFGLYNDASDIDASRVSVLLPQSLYPNVGRDFLLAQNGMEIFGYVNLDALGALDYRVYAGTINLEIASTSTLQVNQLNIPYVAGGRLLWETPVKDLKLGGSVLVGQLDADLSINSSDVEAEVDSVLWVSSVEYIKQKWEFAVEYGRWSSDLNSNNESALASRKTISERGYILAEYRLQANLQLGLYYSVLYPDVDTRSGRANQQHDVATTLRVDITDNWLAKLEVHYMHGTADLDTSINENKTLGELEKNWGVLLLKTTAYY